MPNMKLRVLFFSLILVFALGLSFTVGALALDGEASSLSAQLDLSDVDIPEAAAAVSASDIVLVSPSDAVSVSGNAFSSLGNDDNLDIALAEAASDVTLADGSTGQVQFFIKKSDLPPVISPGLEFDVPVYLATNGLQLWYLEFYIDFNSDALKLDVSQTKVSYTMDGMSIELNGDPENAKFKTGSILTAMTDSEGKDCGISSASFDNPVKLFSFHFLMPKEYENVKAVIDQNNAGGDTEIDGILSLQLQISKFIVSPSGSGILSDQRQTVQDNQAAAFSTETFDIPESHTHTYRTAGGGLILSKGVSIPATCTDDGVTRYTCDLCHYSEDVYASDKLSAKGEHTLTKIDESTATRSEENTAPCYPYVAKAFCQVCSDRSESVDVLIDTPTGMSPTAAHSLVYRAETDDAVAHWECSSCGLFFPASDDNSSDPSLVDTSVDNILTNLTPGGSHSKHLPADVEKKEPNFVYKEYGADFPRPADVPENITGGWSTTTTIECWHCTVCDGYYSIDPSNMTDDEVTAAGGTIYGYGDEALEKISVTRVAGDVTGDGEVDTGDISRLLRYMTEKNNEGAYSSNPRNPAWSYTVY